jgi:hypothetical protein
MFIIKRTHKCFSILVETQTQTIYNNTTNIQSPLQFLLQLKKEQKKTNPFDEKSTTPTRPQLNEGRAAAAHRERCRPYSPRAQATAARALGLALHSSWPRASL